MHIRFDFEPNHCCCCLYSPNFSVAQYERIVHCTRIKTDVVFLQVLQNTVDIIDITAFAIILYDGHESDTVNMPFNYVSYCCLETVRNTN